MNNNGVSQNFENCNGTEPKKKPYLCSHNLQSKKQRLAKDLLIYLGIYLIYSAIAIGL